MNTQYKFYLKRKKLEDVVIEPVAKPTFEEWETLYGYEPTKVHHDYETFCDMYIERETANRMRIASVSCSIEGVPVPTTDETDPETKRIMSEVEQNEPGFDKWI